MRAPAVSVIGLGIMGGAVSGNLLQAGFRVTGLAPPKLQNGLSAGPWGPLPVVPPGIIEALLNHRPPVPVRTYQVADRKDEKRAALGTVV
jgi:hypothetical protein